MADESAQQDSTADMLDMLYDDLYDSLTFLCHYYEGMKRELAELRYDREQAERDLTTLTFSEGADILPILADILKATASVEPASVEYHK